MREASRANSSVQPWASTDQTVQEPSWKTIRGASSQREGQRRKGEGKEGQPGKLVDFQGLP